MTERLYRKLQQNLDRMPVPFPATESGVEIRILERLFTPEEAEVALALSMVPEPPAAIRRRLGRGWTLERLEPLLEQMRSKGVIEAIRVRGARRYGKSMLAVGIYERQLTHLTAELERAVEQYFDEAFGADEAATDSWQRFIKSGAHPEFQGRARAHLDALAKKKRKGGLPFEPPWRGILR